MKIEYEWSYGRSNSLLGIQYIEGIVEENEGDITREAFIISLGLVFITLSVIVTAG